jgi:hypothetical protein
VCARLKAVTVYAAAWSVIVVTEKGGRISGFVSEHRVYVNYFIALSVGLLSVKDCT